MTLLDALAAAVRDRLLDGAKAPLPGIGTLLRAHVPARSQARADGTRVLLPPGVAVGLASQIADPTEIAQALVRYTGAPAETAAVALRDAVDQLEAHLAMMGEARLTGVGTFQRSISGVRFAPAPDLMAAVNRPFETLAPVVIPAPRPAEQIAEPLPAVPVDARLGAAPEARTEPSAPAEPVGSDAVETLLDLIVNEPTEVSPLDARLSDEVSPAASAFADDEAPAPFAPPGLFEESARVTEEPTGASDALADASEAIPAASEMLPDIAEARVVAEPVVSPAPPLPEPRENPPLDTVPDVAEAPVAEAPSSGRAWALVYGALVLGLVALLLWWTVQERRADPPAAVSGTAAAASSDASLLAPQIR